MWASRFIRSVCVIASLVAAASTGTAASDSRAGLGPASPAPAPASPATDATAPPSPEPDADLWLRGPFGRVAGGPVDSPAAARPLGAPLDAFVRRAPLFLESDSDSLLGELTIVAESLADSGGEEVLSDVGPGFAGPDVPGAYRIVATLGSALGDVTERAWLVDVPDREPPPDGLYDIPAPDVLIESADASVAGVLGDGCYVYLCVEAGPAPPLATLEELRLRLGEVPLVRLSDGSAITAWEGRLSPVGRTRGRPQEAAGAVTDTTEAVVALAGLEPPAAGTYRLDLEVTLDRERGWLRTTHRVMAR